MKKAMLFFAAFLFSVSAHAATLNLTAFGSSGATQNVTVPSGDIVLANGTVQNNGSWQSLFDVTTDVTTPVKISWTFNPENLISAQLQFGEITGLTGPYEAGSQIFNITESFSFTTTLVAGLFYGVDIFNASSSSVLNYDLSISAVPVPAALFLFAPALFGFMAMRRRASLSKTVTA